MRPYYYDLHLHSCLSPCADDDMTPNNIAGMAVLAGLQIAALTDHNSCKNCPAFFAACKRQGIVPVAGMELTTAEDIHLVCLFETLEQAMDFDAAVEKQRILFPNRTDIYGEQLILDEEDHIVSVEENLLSNATMLSLEDGTRLAREYGAVVYPAHVDREANGILSILGTLPQAPVFPVAEFHDADRISSVCERVPQLKEKKIVISSDAHFLGGIPDAKHYFLLDDEPYSTVLVRRRLFEQLAGGDR